MMHSAPLDAVKLDAMHAHCAIERRESVPYRERYQLHPHKAFVVALAMPATLEPFEPCGILRHEPRRLVANGAAPRELCAATYIGTPQNRFLCFAVRPIRPSDE